MPWRLKTVPRVTVTSVPTGKAALSTAIRVSRACSSAADTERRMAESESLIALHDRPFPVIPQKLWTPVQGHSGGFVLTGQPYTRSMAFHRRIDREPVGTTGG